MNTLVPFSNIEQMNELISFGAKELFCGYVPYKWIKKFNKDSLLGTLIVLLNKRANISANLTSRDDLIRAVTIAREKNVKLFITVNALYYPDPLWKYLKAYLVELESCGVEHCIVSDIALMKYITENTRLYITVSCLNNVINSFQVYFYKQFRVERIVFPRHISLQSIIQICKQHPDMQFEYFIISDKCIYDDGNCHCNDPLNTEYYNKNGDEITPDIENDLLKNEYEFKRWSVNKCAVDRSKHRWNSIGCSLCSLPRLLILSNIVSLKIVGRGFGTNGLREILDIVNRTIIIAQKGNGKTLKDYSCKVFSNLNMYLNNRYCIVTGN